MSPSPLSKFSKLSISPTMEQASRGTHASSIGKGKGKAPLQDETSNDSDDQDELEGDEDEDPEEDDGEEATDNSNDGHLMALDHCRPIYNSDKTLPVYAFQIAYAKVEPYSLRIYDRGGLVTCSCEEEDCRHREWLLRQLSMIPSGQGVGAGPGPATVDYYNRIRRTGSHGLEDVCRALDWEFREGDTDTGTEWELKKQFSPSMPVEDPEYESHRSPIRNMSDEIPHAGEGRQTRRTIAQRVNAVRDIMDTLSGAVRPEDYRRDIFETLAPTNININNVYVPHDLEATISRLLVFDDRIFYLFELLVSNDRRAVNFFSKMQLKAENTIRLLDNYIDNGPADGQHDIIWSAQELVNIVASIDTNFRDRQPLSLASQTAAAGTLVSILEMVVARNQEAYARIKWHRQKKHGEGRIHRNLYARLIGTLSSENPSGGTFVLRALQGLGPAARVYVERLETILYNLGPRASQAPQAYQDTLRRLIAELRGMPRPDRPGPSSSSGKRSGGSSSTDRNIKRMK